MSQKHKYHVHVRETVSATYEVLASSEEEAASLAFVYDYGECVTSEVMDAEAVEVARV